MGIKKGQMIFEFIIAAVVLFSIIVYTLTYVNGEVSLFSGNFRSDRMESKVIRLSESLLNPYSHHNIVDKWPILDHDKILLFNNTCNNDLDIYNDMELYEIDPLGGRHNIHLRILATELTPPKTIIIDCGRLPIDIVDRPLVYEVKRIGIVIDPLSGMQIPVEIKIWLW
jgi:hypothetical protein